MRGKHVSAFPAMMVEGCEAALDAGVFYQDEFRDFVVKHMGGYDCEAVLAETVTEPSRDTPDYFKAKCAVMAGLSQRIAESPRGHYALVKYIGSDESDRYTVKVSDGSGKLAVGGSYDGYDAPPTGEKVLERMIGYEIYECRQALEEKCRIEADIAALEKHDFKVGMEFKDYKDPSETKRFSRAVIEAVCPKTGTVKLHLVRRGTSKRWNADVGAKRFAEIVGAAIPEPEKHPFIVVVNQGNDDLFGAATQ